MPRKSATTPLYKTLFDRLSGDIISGRYTSDQKLPSEAALVKKYNVSRITVSRALRELQQQGYIDRVAGSGTYVRGAAQSRREHLTFGLIIPNLGETEIFEPICQGIAASPNAQGHCLIWGQADARSAGKEEQALQLCRQYVARAVSGVFFAPLELSQRSAEINLLVMKSLKQAQIPVVLLDRRPDPEGKNRDRTDLVGIDNYRAGYLAADHLLGLGARRIGFIAHKDQASTVKARYRGYKEALSGSALRSAEGRVIFVAPGERLAFPSAARDCDALVCANDRIAGLVMHALLAKGMRIPHDVRLVGIDDVQYASLLPAPLTTVRQPCRDIGETALRVMLERLERPRLPARDILLDCELIIRDSCGASPRAIKY